MDQGSEKSSVRFLSFTNDKEDAEKNAKLKEAAEAIEQAIAKQKAFSELIDVKIPTQEEVTDLTNDTRPLYERLLEQKNKKQEALEESQKFSNLVTKLDEDDVDYLNSLAKTKQEEELRKRLEVYDAMEEKKRLNETRILEEERLMKQSLLGTNMSSKSSPSKSKLSSLMKLKQKTTPKLAATSRPLNKPDGILLAETQSSELTEYSGGPRQTRSSSKRNAQSEDSDKGRKSGNESKDSHNDESTKRQKIDERDEEPSDDKRKNIQPESSSASCCCPDNVMKCIGILPSLPIVEKFHDSDSDTNSDDDLGTHRRLVSRVARNK